MENKVPTIIIPAYNEDSYIYDLLKTVSLKYPQNIIIVIDDGSDKPIVFKNKNVHVLKNKKRRGKGYSILKGIDKSVSIGSDFSIVIDGDMQHNPDFIQDFINENSDYDLVLGYRDISPPMPFHRIFSNKITSYIISFLSGFKIKDSQCGFRRYKNLFIKNNIFLEKGFQFESEVLLNLGKQNKVSQVPIKTIYNDSKSHMNIWSDTLKFIRLILRHLFNGK